MANTKLKSIHDKQRAELTDRPKSKTKTKTKTKGQMIRSKTSFKAADIKQTKSKVNSKLRPQTLNLKLKRRSLLMRKAMQPLLPPQGKSKQKAKGRVGKRKQPKEPSSTNATIVIVKNSEHRTNRLLSSAQKRRPSSANNQQLPKQKTRHQKPARISAGADGGYTKGQQSKVPPPQSLLPHLGSGVQKEAYGTFGYKRSPPPRPIQKNEELVVPLSSRLPIIDFISTDEFERLHSFKMKHKKRFPVDGKPNDKLKPKNFWRCGSSKLPDISC
ncbi:hypothetical protein AWZ03_014030 [Drosophila navojoa]|uniref:Uncharacterized protein n=1 Tax=Drosophila navojoa TaxID=7232 RepID=A0A484AT40_DRONA|nr:uncharacterized protein LOC108655548 [Drosophila navojoa]TDG39548.1 hypothetical protein AWZ03_014030 [Drosophila navojoa]